MSGTANWRTTAIKKRGAFAGVAAKSERWLGTPLKSLGNCAAICGQLIIVHRFPDVIKQPRFFISVQFPTMVAAI
jgi:hypothetical protein